MNHFYTLVDHHPGLRIGRLKNGGLLAVYARCSLEGWGVNSDDFSSRFADTYCQCFEPQPEDLCTAFADAAFMAFDRSSKPCIQEDPDSIVLSWVSGEFLALYIINSYVWCSWIGDFYFVLSDLNSIRETRNIPHIFLFHDLKNGTSFRCNTKYLRIDYTGEEGTPDTIGPLAYEISSVIRFGAGDLILSAPVATRPVRKNTAVCNTLAVRMVRGNGHIVVEIHEGKKVFVELIMVP